jgi:hypothetical protein
VRIALFAWDSLDSIFVAWGSVTSMRTSTMPAGWAGMDVAKSKNASLGTSSPSRQLRPIKDEALTKLAFGASGSSNTEDRRLT